MNEMNAADRQLIEEMFKGQTHYLNAQFENVQDSFSAINARLDKLNGKVAEHEKIINQNVPHNISHCVQTKTIEEIRDNMITSKSLKRVSVTIIGSAASITAMVWIIIQIVS